MVTQALQEAIAALTDAERYELIEYIERTMDGDVPPPDAATVALLRARSAELDADPSLGLTREEHMRRVRALLP